jgi:hypothetical protein
MICRIERVALLGNAADCLGIIQSYYAAVVYARFIPIGRTICALQPVVYIKLIYGGGDWHTA